MANENDGRERERDTLRQRLVRFVCTRRQRLLRSRPVLHYFDEILDVEHKAINQRREENRREPLGPPTLWFREKDWPTSFEFAAIHRARPEEITPPPTGPHDVRCGGSAPPDMNRSRPKPTPSDAIGLSLSGGGIRSAAFRIAAKINLMRRDFEQETCGAAI